MDHSSSCAGGMTCGQLGASVQTSLNSGTFSCTGTTTCSCTQTVLPSVVDTGTYSTTGDIVTITNASAGTAMSGGYCLQGSTLHLVTVDATMNTGPVGQPTIDKDITAQKQ